MCSKKLGDLLGDGGDLLGNGGDLLGDDGHHNVHLHVHDHVSHLHERRPWPTSLLGKIF